MNTRVILFIEFNFLTFVICISSFPKSMHIWVTLYLWGPEASIASQSPALFGCCAVWCGVWMFPPMLKRRSLSTEDGGEHNILSATFPDSGDMLRLVFHHLRGSTSRGPVEDSKMCPVHFSELMMISEHFSFLKFIFLRFARLMLHLMTNHQRKSQSRTCQQTRHWIQGLYHSDFQAARQHSIYL